MGPSHLCGLKAGDCVYICDLFVCVCACVFAEGALVG